MTGKQRCGNRFSRRALAPAMTACLMNNRRRAFQNFQRGEQTERDEFVHRAVVKKDDVLPQLVGAQRGNEPAEHERLAPAI